MTPWVTRLLVANVAIFALTVVAPDLVLWNYLAFFPPAALIRPWTFVTYMFLHGGWGHIIFNMIGLFFFGSRVEARLGGRRFLTLYALAGITGAVASLIFTPRAAIIGASGGVFGIMMAFAWFWPREPIYIWGVVPVEARLLVILTTGLALFSIKSGSGGGIAHFAHLGGYVGAWLYLVYLERNTGQRRFQQKVNAVDPSVRRSVELNRSSLRLEGVHQLTKEEVDRILDKINAQGMSSLTPEELRFLSNFAPLDDRRPPIS